MSNSFLANLSSSLAEFAESRTARGHGSLCQRLIELELVRASYSQEVFHRLVTNLIRIAEHSIGLRDMEALAEVSEILLNLALPEAKQAGTYYYALIMKRRGQTDEARTLLEKIADSPTANCRARAMQTLGAIHHEHNDLDEAGRFYLEALRAGGEHDLITTIFPRLTISALKSAKGDHHGALADLEGLLPLMRLAAKPHPFYFNFYHNALAVEFAELGRLVEAEAACAIALASPFAPVYPEFAETRDEIADKRASATPSVVAVKRAPEADTLQRTQPEQKELAVSAFAFTWPARRDAFQRSLIRIAASRAITNIGIGRIILDRVLSCIAPRAPPALF